MGVDGQLRHMVGWPSQRFLDLVGCKWPIIQAPMAGAGGIDLCVAAIEGGALGSLPCALLEKEQVRQQVQEVRSRTSGPFNLNFFCHSMPKAADDRRWRAVLKPFYDQYEVEQSGLDALRLPFDEPMAKTVEELRPDVVSFHFGLPEPRLFERVKQSGALILSSATTVEEARWLERRGVDAVIAQGFEAGGHSGRFLKSDPAEAVGLFALLPMIADALRVPVIAAGGIADGRGIAAAFILGASAVQLGTAYLHAPETPISRVHRSRLEDTQTLVTNLFTGGLARGLRGKLIDELGAVRAEVPPYPLASAALAPLRANAQKRGDYEFGPMWAGQAGPLGQSLPAAKLTAKLATDALAILAGQS